MAEFQEVMREWVRSRKAINEDKLSYWPLNMFTNDFIANIEKEVMEWAAEHPVVYPTWWEWLVSIGAVTRKVTPDVALELANTGLMDQIDPDTANELGIEPKEDA